MSGPVDPRLWRASTAMRRFLVWSTACGVLTAGATIASAVVLADIVARIITDADSRSLSRLALPLSVLVLLWIFRTVITWQQGRLAQRGASEVIADLSRSALTG